MQKNGRKLVIVGGGIAGLCAAVYAQKCGYQAQVLEMHDMAGGLAMSWRRGGYTFETCLHWLYGSNPNRAMFRLWHEVFDIEKLKFVDPAEFLRIETEDGDSLSIPTNVDSLEEEFLKRAPQDLREIRHLASTIRRLQQFEMPDPGSNWLGNASALLRDLACLPALREVSKITAREYGQRFTDPLIKNFFAGGDVSDLSAVALIISMAWMGARDAGYAVGGALAIIRLIEARLASLGGQVRFRAKVERILVEGGAAVGVQLAGGEVIKADWVVSAADGHATIFDLLDGKYASVAATKPYSEFQSFPSYLQVSLGIALDLHDLPAYLVRLLQSPLEVDPGTVLNQLSFRLFHFDPTFAPAGKTAVTCFLPTRNFAYWEALRQDTPEKYRAEKHRLSEAVIDVLEARLPGLRAAIEVVDVSTPSTIIRYTGNWKGSMEGWLLTPKTGIRPLPRTLPGLSKFMMIGQWTMPGGGLPSGPMTARPAIEAICKQDRVPFTPRTAHVRHTQRAAAAL
jgi:phytoene dehydrogenase-like protein